MAQGANTFQIVSPVSPDTAQAERVVASTYGDTVSVLEKKKDLLKFGRNFAAGTSYSTVWAYGDTLANEVLPTTSSTSDTGTVVIEGHTISGSDLTFVVQTATLNGQNKVVLTTPLARATRIKNTGTADFVGDIYVYEDDTISAGVPTTSTKVHLTARAGYGNQSLKCATSISSVDYWFISHIKCGVLKKSSAFADFQLQVRNPGEVFRTVDIITASSSGGVVEPTYSPHIIVPKNSDVRIICAADTANTDVIASIYGSLAKVI